MTMLANSIAFSEAEKRAGYAAQSVIKAIAESIIQNQQELFDTSEERSAAGKVLTQLEKDVDFRSRLESSFIAWIAESQTLLPPRKL